MHGWNYQWRHIIVTALTFTAGVAWNKAFEDLFSNIPILKNNGSLIYALLITIVVVILVLKIKPAEGDAIA